MSRGRKLNAGSVLSDIQHGGNFTPVPVAPPLGSIVGASVAPGSLGGSHYAETRAVIPYGFDDSIDPTYPLDCFFQMPAGVLKIYSAKLWVKAAPFRSYATAATASGTTTSSSSAGSDNPTSAGGAHSHAEVNGTASATTGNESADHSHIQTDTTPTQGASPAHHTHSYTYQAFVGISNDSPAHTHTVAIAGHTHTTDLAHTHGITYGIYESGAGTGTISVAVADDGVSFGGTLVSGANISTDIKLFLSLTAGDRQIRVSSSGGGTQARVKVLLILDCLLKVDVS